VEKTGERQGEDRKKTRGEKQASREERLAAALRENLRKRKAQARAREGGGGSVGGTGRDHDPA
jgi:hypothetical protein